jgi:hypothetical protein
VAYRIGDDSDGPESAEAACRLREALERVYDTEYVTITFFERRN